MTERAKLIERLEKATGPDRELDTEIELIADPTFADSVLRHAKPYTASLDAAVALVERLLPEFCIEIFVGTRGMARVFNPASHGNGFYSGIRATPALALCLALLKALEARDKPTI